MKSKNTSGNPHKVFISRVKRVPATDTQPPAEVLAAEAVAQAFKGSSKSDFARLEQIMNLLPCYVFLVGPDHTIYFQNKAFVDFFGAGLGKSCHEVLRGSDTPCPVCPPLDGLQSNSSSVMEWISPRTRHVFRVYTYPFHDIDGMTYAMKVGVNITAGVRVQEALDLTEQSYRTITDNLAIGIAMLTLDRRITTGNIRLTEWFGQEFSRGRSICDILKCANSVPESERPCPGCLFQTALDALCSQEKEMQVRFISGEDRHVRLLVKPVSPKMGKPRALLMMLEDITNRKRVNMQLQRVRKLEAMATLAGGIAHEINQPLSALHLYASGMLMLLDKNNALPRETIEERLNFIMREADKIRSIIAHMRSLVLKQGDVPVGPVNIRRALDEALSLMGHQFLARKIDIVTDIPSNLPLVKSNALQLGQVFLNLLGNAMHAIDSKSPETAETEHAPVEEQQPVPQTSSGRIPHLSGKVIAISARRIEEGKKVCIEVADSGPGLPKGSERIFDPFYTTKESHQGMGLGLSIVHGLVNLWGGEVSARVKHPKLGGAVFFIVLDAIQPEQADSSDAGAPSPQDY